MRKRELKNKSIAELKSEIKRIKTTSGVILGMSLVLFAVAIYGIIINHEYAIYFAVIVLFVSSILNIPSLFGSVNRIKTELESRKNDSQFD